MDKTYWDKLANNFEQDVFEVFRNDSEGLIAKAIKHYGGKDNIACDIGCGVGSLLPILAKEFNKVIAIDISSKCLQKAEEKCADFTNISYIAEDLSSVNSKLPKSDFSICVNAVIFPSLEGRINFLDTSTRVLKKDGVLVLVVPALESALLRNQREVQWNLKSGENPQQAQDPEFVGVEGISAKDLSLGIVNIDGVATKHFLKEEIQLMLEERQLSVLNIAKLEYDWDTEFFNPPNWMQAPYPWDWFCLAQKI